MKYFIISVILLFFSLLSFTVPINVIFTKIVGPAHKNFINSANEIHKIFVFFENMYSVSTDYENLYVEYQSIKSENVKLKLLEKENLQLRTQLKITNSSDILKNKKFVYTNIYKNSQDSSGNTMVLDSGSINGVKKGSVVIKDNNIVGIVQHVFSGKSIVSLLTSSSIKIPVYNISDSDQNEFIVQGRFGTSIVIENILAEDKLKEGDILVTSSRSTEIPSNLIVGKIVKIDGEISSITRTAFVESFVNTNTLTKVFVIID